MDEPGCCRRKAATEASPTPQSAAAALLVSRPLCGPAGLRGRPVAGSLCLRRLATIRGAADRDAGLQIRWPNDLADRSCGNQFHPDGVPVLEPGGLARLAQGIHAALLRSGRGLGVTRQLEHDP